MEHHHCHTHCMIDSYKFFCLHHETVRFRLTSSTLSTMTSTMMFWYLMSTMVATDSRSGRMRVGPKHTPMLLAFIRLTSDAAATLWSGAVVGEIHNQPEHLHSAYVYMLHTCTCTNQPGHDSRQCTVDSGSVKELYMSLPYTQLCKAPITWNTIIAICTYIKYTHNIIMYRI